MILILTRQRGLPQLVRAMCRATGTRDAGVELGELADDQHLRTTGVLHARLEIDSESAYCLFAADDLQLDVALIQGCVAAEVVLLCGSAEDGLRLFEDTALRVLGATANPPAVAALLDSPSGDAELLEFAAAELRERCEELGLVLLTTVGVSLDGFLRCTCSEPGSCSVCRRTLEGLRTAAAGRRDRQISGPSLMLPTIIYEKVTVTQRGRLAQPVPFGLLTSGRLALGDTVHTVGGEEGGKPLTVRSIQVFGEARDEVAGPAFITAMLDGAKPRQVAAPRVLASDASVMSGSEHRLDALTDVEWGRIVPGRLRIVTPAWSSTAMAVEAEGHAAGRLVLSDRVASVGPAVGLDDDGIAFIGQLG